MTRKVKIAAGTMVSAAIGMTAWMAIVPAKSGAGWTPIGCPPGFAGSMPATYGFQPTYDPMPKMAYQAPIAYQPKPQSRPVSQPQFQPKPSPAPKADTSVASGDREPPAGYRYRIHVPQPDEIGIVLPE